MPNTNKYNKIIIDKQIYPIEAALSAGYALSDELYIYLDLEGKDKIAVYIKPKKEKVDRNKWEEEFLNQLLYEAEKIAVSKRNKKVREFIVGRALFSSVESVSANNDNY
jgi:His-Xaa-Ser system protein HxsD